MFVKVKWTLACCLLSWTRYSRDSRGIADHNMINIYNQFHHQCFVVPTIRPVRLLQMTYISSPLDHPLLLHRARCSCTRIQMRFGNHNFSGAARAGYFNILFSILAEAGTSGYGVYIIIFISHSYSDEAE